MNLVGIPRGFLGNAGFSGNLGVWGGFGRFGASEGFCANSQVLDIAMWHMALSRLRKVLPALLQKLVGDFFESFSQGNLAGICGIFFNVGGRVFLKVTVFKPSLQGN